MILALIIVGYVLLGVGTARIIAGRVARQYPYADADDPEIVLPSLFGGVFWPIAWVWLLIGSPIISVVGPAFVAWFAKPYRKGQEAGRR